LNGDTELWEAVLSNARGLLTPKKDGAPVTPPWATPGDDAIGGAFFAQGSLFIDGADVNPGFAPQPGDQLEYIPDATYSIQKGIYKQVADTLPWEGQGLDCSELPICRLKRTV
jgi:hypothetical protein